MARFEQVNWRDCKISAYPPASEISTFVGVNLDIAPSIIMIDLDRETFNTQKALEMALSKTLERIGEIAASTLQSSQNDFQPTVIWSGNGYHIYLVLDALVLEQENAFNNSRFGSNPSQKFLRFAEWFLSNGKCDPQHNRTVSLRNSMLRIPKTINSKNGQMVKIIQKWNGYRPSIKLLLEDFYVHLCYQKLAELQIAKRRSYKLRRQFGKSGYPDRSSNTICWIERLLHTPISDYRKLAVWRILAPYLRNKRGLSYDESYSIIRDWLDKCNQVKRLDFNPHYKIKGALNSSNSFLPISKEKLKNENFGLYHLLQQNGAFA